MIVVSDTSPLNYLVLSQAVDVLPRLYGQVYVTTTVMKELQHPRTPQPVKDWLATSPPWVRVQDPTTGIAPFQLDLGETSAILLAEELHADRLLIDERQGYKVAKARGLRAVGTLAVLIEASKASLINLRETLGRLEQQTTFRMTAELRKIVLAQVPPAP